MANPSITPFNRIEPNAELNYGDLYLHQIYSGPNPNQANIISQDGSTGLGASAVNNWAIYDGAGATAKLVARAQGMHMQAGNWYNSFIIVFEIARFKGSTLAVMGSSIDATSDWAIVGGTGEFEMAQGVIKRKVHEKIADGEIQQLNIRASYVSKNVPTLKELGPWGGNWDGADRDVRVKPQRLVSITVRTGRDIHSIAYSYLDKDGNKHESGQWGWAADGTTQPTIVLGPSEVVTEVSGTYATAIISSLKFVTNLKTYGPYGTVYGTPFKAPVPNGSTVVGFFAISGRYLDKIGVYTM